MELLLGFILGIVTSVIASFLFSWFTVVIPQDRQRKFVSVLRNPRLSLRVLRDTEERKVKDRIQTIFKAWCEKDSATYLSCWADDCVRVIGTNSTIKENKEAIAAKFAQSCEKYSEITVPIFIVENIRVSHDSLSARAEAFYKFVLTRAEDSLPVIESSKEFYSLRKENGEWLIVSNGDYFSDIAH
jgi:uncharacterized protein (TIGR02246 family)